MWLHCHSASTSDLAHQQYLLACLFRELNLKEQEELALQNSYSLTSVGAHDFLTKAAAVWACLLIQNRPTDTRDFVLACRES